MPTPAEQFESNFFSVKTDIGWLQDGVRLKNARDAVEDLQTTVNGMAQRISGLRERGYVFEKDLENQAKGFVTQWNGLYPSLLAQLNQQSTMLQNSLRPLETQLNQLGGMKTNPAMARNLFNSLETGISTLKDKVSAAERTIDGMYNTFRGQVGSVSGHLGEIDWMLTQLAEATFKLLPTEGGIMAVKAVWCADVKEKPEDPDGVLYLTDQRLIFEQKEEIATKKILFIATEKKKVQEKEWDVPVALLEEIKTSKQGMMKNEDHLDLRFGPGANHQTIHLHIWQPVEQWQALLNKAKSKEFDKTRAIAIDQAEVDKVKSVPAQCPGCGANMDQVVLRGQDTVKCEYCGFVVRL